MDPNTLTPDAAQPRVKIHVALPETEATLRTDTAGDVCAALKGVDAQKDPLVEAYLTNTLSGETRLETPMNPNCKVSVVVPAYCERGYIFRPLLSLAQQKGVTPDQYELIVVVNNAPSLPQQSLQETPDDYDRKLEHYRNSIQENQDTMALIRRINGEAVDVATSPEEDEMIATIRAAGIRVQFIDKASAGATFPLNEAHVGSARDRGVGEAVARFYESGRDGIIAQSDADTRFDETYIQELIAAFAADPKLVGIAGNLQFDNGLEGENELMRLIVSRAMLATSYKQIIDELSKVQTDQNPAADTATEDDGKVHFSGANMASRAFAAARAGGVPHLAGGEDPAFGAALAKLGKVAKSDKIITKPAQRFSARTDVNCGHGQQLIKQSTALEKGEDVTFTSVKRLKCEKQIIQNIGIAIATGRMQPEHLQGLLTVEGVPLLERQDIAQLSDLLSGIKSLEDLERIDDPRLNVMKNKALEKLKGIFPDHTFAQIAQVADELESEFLSTVPALAATYEYLKNDNLLDQERYNLIISLVAQAAPTYGIPATKDQFLGMIEKLDSARYSALSDGTTSWQSSKFIEEIFSITAQSANWADAQTKIKAHFNYIDSLSGFEHGLQMSKFFAMQAALSRNKKK